MSLLVIHPVFGASNKITMATTTSTENSGLLDYLLPMFERHYHIQVKVIATGTGRALKLAERGDVDIVMVHAPSKEEQFVESGYGIQRKSLMYNKFLIVGPRHNPANIAITDKIGIIFSKIASQKIPFISRADNSGTYIKEQSIWASIDLRPHGSWYKQVGQGMGKTLQITDELNAYTLVDMGTWLKLKDKTNLVSLYHNDSETITFNPYSVILINPKKHPHTHYKSAKILSNWLTSTATKKIINQYKINEQQLFFAN
ncbi:Tungstate ABC transporter, substrate-binding protein [uncultured Gammaproteobacteria bacterium]|jgi:tungstate transport system substrate-binding protein|uniref:Tungstate ABC transporter, substrate-binding protein n=2 Tax=Bathymodiolus azoricus thioautotrophic gill symbiont TaxID=235205 RepID=A0ACA8ZTF9_9GAMM|nr:Tungstate ABC transporter, substrate-binding protein [Bathymodiolus azoricus thioautotrophic gill symbiont]CAC9490182.1 Tungstate ABC transporter, substrate-binding protein [uncultured Gammaproteobacteria bacterium]CAC9516579.1 Tungstate ABC transporter, substrate-binding protein [uncultured Gammaproteobacteria bacterium]CAC9542056.1 Tungstate ABC transporter, substrate-binding protein [uncultured Gammaproteobacteria bacterium]CAC9592663.1 Tungstate ABC transporter, substrate-binding protein